MVVRHILVVFYALTFNCIQDNAYSLVLYLFCFFDGIVYGFLAGTVCCFAPEPECLHFFFIAERFKDIVTVSVVLAFVIINEYNTVI